MQSAASSKKRIRRKSSLSSAGIHLWKQSLCFTGASITERTALICDVGLRMLPRKSLLRSSVKTQFMGANDIINKQQYINYMQQSTQANMMEMKAIFQLFDPEGTDEISIQHVNNLIRDLETLKSETDSLAVPSQPGRKYVRKGNPTENFEDRDASPKSPTYVSVTELKCFPNGKTAMRLNDFQELFNECMGNKEQHDELLQNAFAMFDFDKSGSIDSKKIKKIFQKFQDNTTEEEIQNVLKFCGVQNDQMSMDQFKEFFRKNL